MSQHLTPYRRGYTGTAAVKQSCFSTRTGVLCPGAAANEDLDYE